MNSKVFVEIFFVRSPAGGRDPHGGHGLRQEGIQSGREL